VRARTRVGAGLRGVSSRFKTAGGDDVVVVVREMSGEGVGGVGGLGACSREERYASRRSISPALV
jgi:hypothetical protein